MRVRLLFDRFMAVKAAYEITYMHVTKDMKSCFLLTHCENLIQHNTITPPWEKKTFIKGSDVGIGLPVIFLLKKETIKTC